MPPAHATPPRATDVARLGENVVRFYDNVIVPSVGGADQDLILFAGSAAPSESATTAAASVAATACRAGGPLLRASPVAAVLPRVAPGPVASIPSTSPLVR
ncbi:hypothetical protein [Aquipuribacter nitratireducens]|uniref:Uncharacterized protein n=1 Tax=Aquipuribacter nitratireducens TaxID=650104 RepID=A0ABW0GNI7_9MICO